MKAHQRRPGLWEAKGLSDDGRRRSYYGSTPELAIKKARESVARYRAPVSETLETYFLETFVPTIGHLAQNTKKVYAAAFDEWWLPEFGSWRIADIKRHDVQRAVNRMARSVSSGTVAQYRSKLVTVLDLASSDGLVTGNAARGARCPKVVSVSPKPLTSAGLWSLYLSTDGAMRNAVLLMGFLGLRIGEACGAMKSDLSDGLLRVERQWPDLPLKTASSRRAVPVPFPLAQTEGLRIVGLSPNEVRRKLDVPPHSLRHTFSTVLEWELDCPRRVTDALMGHKGGTGGIYSHASPAALREWTERFWLHVSTGEYDGLRSHKDTADRLA